MAGGIGITPLLSMLHTLKAAGQSFELHYSARQLTDLAFRQDIEHLIGERANLYASQEPGQARLDLQQILAEPSSDTHVYVCGPRPMINAVRDLAQANGWPAEQIRFESFGPAASPHDRALSVMLARSGKTINVPASRSILDTLLDEGLAIPHDCKRGECSLLSCPEFLGPSLMLQLTGGTRYGKEEWITDRETSGGGLVVVA